MTNKEAAIQHKHWDCDIFNLLYLQKSGYRPFVNKWEVKYKFLLTFVKVTYKQMLSNIFVALRKITAKKTAFCQTSRFSFQINH